MKASIWTTDALHRLEKTQTAEMVYRNTDVPTPAEKPHDLESGIVNIHPNIIYQNVGGIGGAFTDSSASLWASAPPETQAELIRSYFDPQNGIGYNFGRLTIGSCDFSVDDYTYVREGDMTLDSFSLSHDCQNIFPMVRAAQKYGNVRLFASPWSPPAYMKQNHSRIGGRLRDDCYGLWAKYIARYVDACRRENIGIWGLTLQNEPRHPQSWESCQFTPAEEAAFLGILARELTGSGVKLFCYDHCRERVLERAEYIFAHENAPYCDGIAHHWYSGSHFGELAMFRKEFPDKLLIASEECCAIPDGDDPALSDLSFAERYGRDLCGCFRSGVNCYCDWNLVLDEKNGPYHNREGRGCTADAPLHIDRRTGELRYRLSYYYIGHFSKFVRAGAKVIGCSTYDDDMDTVAFRNPDGKVAAVLLNRTDRDMPCILRMQEHITEFTLGAHSIVTAIIE